MREETCLDTVVAIGISEELLEARAVEELADQHLARVVLRDTDALQAYSPIRSYFRGEKQGSAPSRSRWS